MNENPETLLRKLNEIGIALSSERDLDQLLDRIVREAMRFTSAEGGTLFIVEEEQLAFAISRNEVLEDREEEVEQAFQGAIPLNEKSISGYVAETGELLNIEDANDLPEQAPYEFNSRFDEEFDYRTKSLLGVPLKEPDGTVLGVLLLINARDATGEIQPFSSDRNQLIRSLASQAGVALRNAKLHEQLKDSYLESLHRLSTAAEYKDPDTGAHIQRISQYTKRLTDELGWTDDRVERTQYASTMHDIGKIGVPDDILLKPGSLTDQEYDQMKEHTSIGHRILRGSDHDIVQLSARIALSHHEKWNGEGYPRGHSGEEIPVEGRVVAVADVFDALVSERPYKEAFSIERSVDIIKEDRGEHFDPDLVDVFLNCLDDFVEIKERFDESGSLNIKPLDPETRNTV